MLNSGIGRYEACSQSYEKRFVRYMTCPFYPSSVVLFLLHVGMVSVMPQTHIRAKLTRIWVRISTRNDEYSKGMNGMNSTKVNDIKDKVNTHVPNIYIQIHIHQRMFIELVHVGTWHDISPH